MQDENQHDERVMTLVEAALQLAPERREAYLRAACEGQPELYAEVAERVDWEGRMGGFLTRSIVTAFEFLDRPFEPGEVVAGRFRVVDEVGRGGMGVVYEAFDEKLSRRVALKSAQGGFGRWLPPEVRAAREVSHFNVCKVHDLHSTWTGSEEVEFLTMEFIEGETLSERIRRSGPVAARQAREIARQICAGLAQAHRQGIIHGDLKCGNIILSQGAEGSGRAVITDFGLAAIKRPADPGSAGQPAGSLDYMAPELFAGAPLSVASDLYALGVVFHYMLTAAAPPAAEPRHPASDKTQTMEFPASGSYTPRRAEGLPAPWNGIVNRCLQPNAADRFATAEEIADRLKEPNKRRRWLLGGAAAAALIIGLWQDHSRSLQRRPAAPVRSVAVIPFVNASSTAAYDYLADGFSEGLINALAQLPDVKVIARSSSFRFKGMRLDIPRASRELGVGALVTGRIAEKDGGFRITAELVNGLDGTQFWGGQYNPAMGELAGTEAEISRRIADEIRAHWSSSGRARLAREANVNPEAYGLLLRGRYQIGLYTPESRKRAVGFYEQALAIEPGFSLANAELAWAYRLLSGSGVQDAADAMPKAEAAARRALAGDEGLAEAHAALADVRKDQWDFPDAEREYRQAIQLNPNLVSAHEGLAICLGVLGRHDDAIAEAQRAVELDPVSLPTAIHAAAVYYNARRFDAASNALRRASKLDPTAPSPWSWLGIVNGATQHFAEAIAAYQMAIQLGDNSAATQCYYAYSLARSGDRAQARQIARRLQQSEEFVPPSSLAIVFAGLGEKDRAIRLLRESFASRDPLLQYMMVESHFDPIRDDSRFRELAGRVGLPR